ncbi:ABC-F family ATP-binding cassette domain-containing protein [Dubosiella newyorkensis]|jgi:ATP-binding cassette subfamily F protein 3|uniref:ABC transporter ATP-binding protein n=3 Tax=Dubosiella newyorkensis TaxID=1862672 RepID=A0A1U7NQ43_9FIRM|nr:ABC-F type ribosomal protection protein [Dubosiella newyorkensis]MCI9041295.1 ABC-F type ribosomal protection protein [Dubosiella newyorkensis]OLU47756.1 ABC transporter ATP-binding protein [Dubosiella newyorkensis]
MKLQLNNVHKSYGAQDVLDGADLQVRGNEKIALIGRNGSGKSTLMKIITKEEEMDSGSLVMESGLQVGYLSQITFEDEEKSVQEELMSVFDDLIQLQARLENQALVLEKDHSEKQLDLYDRLQNRFETLGGYDYEYELKNVFFHFQFEEADLHKKLKEFSSGQRTRIALVKLLLSKPDILLLDEPTNHLDIDSIEWLENYIKHYPNAVILVSHDRMFIDHVVDEIVELEFGKTTRYVGDYSHYIQTKEENLAKNHAAYVRQQEEIKHIESLIEKFRYKKNKAAFAQSKIKYLDRMEKIEDVKKDQSMIKANFSSARKGGNRVLEVEQLQIGYDSILSTVDLNVMRHDHVGIVGPNGIGKSTLIKTLMERLPAKGGHFHFGHQIDLGYFDQDFAQLNSNQSVIDTLWDEYPELDQTELRNTLAAFLFTQDEVFKEVKSLSGGEKVRLALALLMLSHDNVLLLDEPTNHLDIPAKEALEKALKDYDGTILFVSHDRMFLKKMATRIMEMGKESHVYEMGYEEYIEKKKEGTLPKQNQQKKESPEIKNEPKERALTFAQEKNYRNRIAKLESLLEEAEKDLESLRELRYEPEYYQDYRKMEELDSQIDEKHNEIANYTKEWEEKMLALEDK